MAKGANGNSTQGQKELIPPTSRNQYSLPDNALRIPEGFFFADSVVAKIGVADPEGILIPVVTEGFQVPVVVMMTADFQMDDHPFLFSIYIRHRSAKLCWEQRYGLQVTSANIKNNLQKLAYIK